MRKIIGFLFIILAAIMALVFFVLLNLSLFANENKVKALLEESKFYDTAAFYIKDQIIKESGLTLNEGTIFEDLNNSITPDKAKSIVDGAVANVFKALKDPAEENLIFPVIFSSESSNLSFEKYINLNNNQSFEILANRGSYLLITGIATLLLLLAGLLACSGKVADRLVFFGIFSLALFLGLLCSALLLKGVMPQYMEVMARESQIFQEAKLLAMLRRVMSVIANRQSLIYSVEAVGFLVFAVISIWLRKIFIRENLKEIDNKI